MKKIVVTGATSFIGIHLIEQLLAKEYYVYAIVRRNSKNLYRLIPKPNLNIIELDMEEYSDIPSFIKEAECFCHLAWDGVRMPQRDNREIQQRNYWCSVEAMKAAKKIRCQRFIGIGSQAEYGKMTGKITEEYPCNPNTEYGKAKLETKNTLEELSKRLNIEFVWVRVFSLYGKYDYKGSLIMSCIDKMKKNDKIELTQCIQMWDYLHVYDAARAIIALIEHMEPAEIYNIASGDSKELKAYVEDMRHWLKSKSVVEYGAIPYVDNNIVNFEPSVDKLKKDTGWIPKIDFQDGINMLIAEK